MSLFESAMHANDSLDPRLDLLRVSDLANGNFSKIEFRTRDLGHYKDSRCAAYGLNRGLVLSQQGTVTTR